MWLGKIRVPLRAAQLVAVCCCVACAHQVDPKLAQFVDTGQCENGSQYLFQKGDRPPVRSRVSQVILLPLSYVAIGLGYTTNVVLVLAGGVVVGAVVCSPLIALDVASSGDGRMSGECVSEVAGAVISEESLTALGDAIYDGTKKWRCADLTPLSREIRAVARCYTNRRSPGDLDKARQQLGVLGQNRFASCVSDEERQAVGDALREIQRLTP